MFVERRLRVEEALADPDTDIDAMLASAHKSKSAPGSRIIDRNRVLAALKDSTDDVIFVFFKKNLCF